MSDQNDSTIKPNVPVRDQVDQIRPAFSSNATALYFLGLIILTLLLPKMITDFSLVSRTDSYDMMPENFGEYSFIKDEIFGSKEDIDILFIGTSIMWNAIDTPQVQTALDNKLGRSTRVRTFGFFFNGIDTTYAIARDVLEHRRVKMIILSIPREKLGDGASLPGCKFIRYNDHPEVAGELSLSSRFSSYACSTLRSPQDLLTVVRENKSKPSPFAKNLGANKEFLGMGRNARGFERFTPQSPVFTADSLIYSYANKTRFRFTEDDPGEHQVQYLEALIELLREKNVPVLMVNIPQYNERHSNQVIENRDWNEKYGPGIPLVGIPPTDLFAGLNEKEIEKFYCDEDHFNVNGTEFFTRAVLPGILELYENNTVKSF